MSNKSFVICFCFYVNVNLIFSVHKAKLKKTKSYFFTLNMFISLVLVGFKSFITKSLFWVK